MAGTPLHGVVNGRQATIRTIAQIQLKKKGTRILIGHDPQVWRTLKLAPEYCE